jgi:chemotaxis signal transduction protein
MQDNRGGFMVHLLLFSVDDLHCAIPLAETSHVIRMVKLSPPAHCVSHEAGTINLHGTIIPVISMRSVLGLKESIPTLTDMLIIAHIGCGDIALWVDATSGIEESLYFPGNQENKESGGSETPALWITPEGLLVIRDLSLLIAGVSSAPYSEIKFPRPKPEEPDMDFARIDALLEERAKKLAQPEKALSDTAIIEILRFQLAYREYALEMKYIREVILTGEITPVPGTPRYISGICVVRGEIISLVDLRVLLLIPEKGLTDLNRVIVVTNEKLSFGILADQITGIGFLESDKISISEAGIVAAGNNYVKGVAEGPLIVLDAAALFADPKMIIEDS